MEEWKSGRSFKTEAYLKLSGEYGKYGDGGLEFWKVEKTNDEGMTTAHYDCRPPTAYFYCLLPTATADCSLRLPTSFCALRKEKMSEI